MSHRRANGNASQNVRSLLSRRKSARVYEQESLELGDSCSRCLVVVTVSCDCVPCPADVYGISYPCSQWFSAVPLRAKAVLQSAYWVCLLLFASSTFYVCHDYLSPPATTLLYYSLSVYCIYIYIFFFYLSFSCVVPVFVSFIRCLLPIRPCSYSGEMET